MYLLRVLRRLTQAEVAEAVGIAQSSYALIEGGRRHPPEADREEAGGVLRRDRGRALLRRG
ncbi:MAG: helix-turn-helix transcriptional regulator [Bacillota bacterium]